MQGTRGGASSTTDAIHYIDSTGVPGLAAKDAIDVQVSVPRPDDALCDRFIMAGARDWANAADWELPDSDA